MAEDHEQLGRELEMEASGLEEKVEALDQHVKEARSDWAAKRADSAVPGAPPPSEEEEAALGAGGDDSADPEDVPAGGP